MTDLKNIAVGDMVCLVHQSRYSGRVNSVTRSAVERVTKTQIIAIEGRRFLASNGKEVGKHEGRWSANPRLQILTPEIESEFASANAELAAEELCRAIANLLGEARAEDAVRLAAMIGQDLRDAVEYAR